MNTPLKIEWTAEGVVLEGHPMLVEEMRRCLLGIVDDIVRDAKQMRPITPPPDPADPNTYIYPSDDWDNE